MSKRGMFGPGRGRGGRGGSQNLSREWNSMNYGDSGQAFNNYMPPPPLLQRPPPPNMAAANRSSATPYNITVTVNPSENVSHYSQPDYPFQNEAPFQQHFNNPGYPSRGGFSGYNYDSPPNLPPSRFCGPSYQRQPRDARNRQDLPPPYAENRQDLPPPYAEVPPASAHLHGNKRGGFHNQARGLPSRMRGKNSMSCGNLAGSSHYKDVDRRKNDSASSNFSGKEHKGNAKEYKYLSSRNDVNRKKVKSFLKDERVGSDDRSKGYDSDDGVSSIKSGSSDGRYNKNDRGRGRKPEGRGRSDGAYNKGPRKQQTDADYSNDKKSSQNDLQDSPRTISPVEKPLKLKDERVGSDDRSKGYDSDDGVSSIKSGSSDGRYNKNDRGRGRKSEGRGRSDGAYNKGPRKQQTDADYSNDKKSSQNDLQDSPRTISPVEKQKEVNATLVFKTCFETASILANLIKSTIVFPERKGYEICFDQTTLKHKENTAICHFTVCGPSIEIAKQCVNKLKIVLRQKLKATIYLNFSSANGKPSACDDVDGISESRKDKPFKNDSPENKVKDKDGVDNKKNKKIQHTSEASPKIDGDKNEHTKGGCSPIPTTILFSVEEPFSSPSKLVSFIRNVTSQFPFEIEIINGSISLSTQTSKCSIKTKSKANARRLIQAFDDLSKKTQLNITCTTSKYEDNSKSKQDSLGKNLKATKSKLVHSKSEVLKIQDDRITLLKEEFLSFCETKSSNHSEVNFKAIQDKLTEAIKQREVFSSCYTTLFQNLEELKSPTATLDEIIRLANLMEIECDRLRRALPIYAYKDDIIQQVSSNNVSVIVGGSGCGKSTQIMQYLFDAGYGRDGIIACLHPEELVVSNTAEKVAQEMKVKIGSLVGYRTGSAVKVHLCTQILFVTDQCFLDECLEDSDLKKFSCIIIDEVHAHNFHTDLLLGMIKSCLLRRPHLKVILISGSHPGNFIEYFKTSPELSVSGRKFPTKVFYMKGSEGDFEDHEEKAVSIAMEIHEECDEGDILVFLGLPAETYRCCQEFESRYRGEKKFKCLSLHADIFTNGLKKIFKKAPEDHRKIIFATSFGETSISVDGVRYVIDSGLTNEIKYDREQKFNLAKSCPVSKISADLRKDCAGNSDGGKCYRLYSKKKYDDLVPTSVPEILRVQLEKAVLKILDLNVELKNYDFLHAPSSLALNHTKDTLTQYGAIAEDRITQTGKLIAKLPFDPKLGFLISLARENDLLHDAVVLAAIISCGGDFSYRAFSEMDAEEGAGKKKSTGVEKKDCFSWLQVYKEWSVQPKERKVDWCQSHHLDYKLINSVCKCVEKVRSALYTVCNIKLNFEFSGRGDALDSLKRLYTKAQNPHFSVL